MAMSPVFPAVTTDPVIPDGEAATRPRVQETVRVGDQDVTIIVLKVDPVKEEVTIYVPDQGVKVTFTRVVFQKVDEYFQIVWTGTVSGRRDGCHVSKVLFRRLAKVAGDRLDNRGS